MGLVTYRYQRRAIAIEKLRAAGIEVFSSGGYENRVTLQEMADIYRDSQFVINFAETDTYFQCKGRVMEAILCGACLIEHDNPETNHWLRPNIDYLAFATVEELPAKIRYLQEHRDEYERIRQSGLQRAKEIFGAKNVWTKILSFADKVSRES